MSTELDLRRVRKSETKARGRRILAWALAGLVLLGFAGVQGMRAANTARTEAYLAKFTPIPDLGTFQESRPRVYGGTAKFPHAVLLLHGFSASPQEFDHLTRELEAAGIPYYAPQITGFGLDDFRLLREIKPEDWLRDAVLGYDLLAAMADEVSVVGHSNGGALATYVAQHRPVKHLVLSGPNLLPNPDDAIYKRILNTPVLSQVLQGLMPVFAKPKREGRVTNTDTLEPEAALSAFHYPALPIRSLKALWDVQDRVDITRARYQDLTLVYGEQDISVDINAIVKYLDDRQIPYTRLPFASSGHNVLEDYDKEAASRAVADVLKR